MKNILPMSDPVINSYPHHAHVFSIAGAQTNEYIPWVYNCFVQVCAWGDVTQGQLNVDYAAPRAYAALPGMVRDLVARKIALDIWKDIIGFVKYYIDQGYYIYGFFAVNQIAAYQRERFWSHNPLLYGYDEEKEEIYFADNYQHGKYALGTASYEEIRKATEELVQREKDATQWYQCFRYIDWHTPYRFDKSLYGKLLTDYLEQRDSFHSWLEPFYANHVYANRKWGIGVYSFMQEHLRYCRKAGQHLDRRGFYVQKEHKLLLEKSLTYLLGDQWKSKHPIEWQMLERDIKMTTLACNLCLKYNLTMDEQIMDKISHYLVELEANDKLLFPRLINLVEEL